MYAGSLSAENPKILGSGPHSLGFQLSCLPFIFGNVYIWHDPFINLKASRCRWHIVSVWCWHMPVHLEAFRWVAEKCTQRWVIKLRKSNPWKNKYGQYTCPPLWFSRFWLIIAKTKQPPKNETFSYMAIFLEDPSVKIQGHRRQGDFLILEPFIHHHLQSVQTPFHL